jgi:monofunctional glycosyltransferase
MWVNLRPVKMQPLKWLRLRKRRVALALVAALVGLIGIVNGPVVYRITRFKQENPSTWAMMDQQLKKASADGAPAASHTWMPYEQISPKLIRAVVAGEDANFVKHSGFDLKSIQRAIDLNWDEQRYGQGASTITQQLAKNLFLSANKSLWRKLHEALIAFEMEHILSKRRILELYLNIVELDEGVYGVEAGAQHYFGTSAASLNETQALFLSSILPMPREAHDPAAPTGRVQERMALIKAMMPEVETPPQ